MVTANADGYFRYFARIFSEGLHGGGKGSRIKLSPGMDEWGSVGLLDEPMASRTGLDGLVFG